MKRAEEYWKTLYQQMTARYMAEADKNKRLKAAADNGKLWEMRGTIMERVEGDSVCAPTPIRGEISEK